MIANKRLAFAEALNERLGTDSPLNILPIDIFETISYFLSKKDISGGGKIKKYIFTRKKSKNKRKKSSKTRRRKSKRRKSKRRNTKRRS